MAQLSKVLKVVCWAGSVPFPPVSLQRQAVLFADVARVHVFITGESLYRHCFLVGWCTNKSYVIATSDLWLFTHASSLPSLNSPHRSPTIILFLMFLSLCGCSCSFWSLLWVWCSCAQIQIRWITYIIYIYAFYSGAWRSATTSYSSWVIDTAAENGKTLHNWSLPDLKVI